MRALIMVPGPRGATMELQDLPRPEAGPGEVLVAVKASALNRGEIARRRSLSAGKPAVSGIECAGDVVEVGPNVAKARIGDRVMAQAARCYADFVAIDERLLMPVPDSFSWTEAGAFPNTCVTAHDAIVTNGRLRAGESVLVNAASSGVGMIAIQIAAVLGASPVVGTTRSLAKGAAIREAGANVLIDTGALSDSGAWVGAVREATDGKGVDLIIDSVGAELFAGSMRALAIQGRLVGVGRLGGKDAEIDLDLLALNRLSLIGVTFRTRNHAEKVACTVACLADLGDALAAGKLRPMVDRVFPMADIDAAHQYMEMNSHTGKIVIEM